MKTTNFLLRLAVICFIFGNFTSDVRAQTDDLYRSSMQKALDKLDNVTNSSELSDCRNLFERISLKFTAKWQPAYYVAYCDIQLIYLDAKSELNSTHLADAKKQLEKLADFTGTDQSELSTLWGYYYNAQILLNPESAQTLFGQVIASYEKAIGQNPENPRPVILRAFFNQFLPPFVKLKIDAATEVEKAQALFGKEEKSIEQPYWGQFFISQVNIN